MTQDNAVRPPATSTAARRHGLWLAGIIVAFLALRLPPMLHQPGRIDEECYAVPGLTILKTGLPQLPHLPSRNPKSMFYRADEVLYSEPPLYFYLQALVYLVLPATYGTARLSSAAAAVALLWVMYRLGRRWTGSSTAALWGTAILSLSRWLFYPATIARADIHCALFGLLAIAAVCRWQDSPRWRWLAAAGVCIGLGGLMHPLAIVYAIQIAVWLLVASQGRRRLTHPLFVAAVSIAVFALWLPLILVDPELFGTQFRNQFVQGATGSPLFWIMRPGVSLAYHARFLWLSMNPWQCLLIAVPWLVCTVAIRRGRRPDLRPVCHLTWSSFVLISLIIGTHHDVPGYWSYPAALGFICTGWLIDLVGQAIQRRYRPAIARGLLTAGAVLLVAGMFPGSGARLLVTHMRHWNDVNYNAPAFARQLMAQIPPEAACTVDHEYLLDFFAAGRRVLSVPTSPIYLNAEDLPYDYLVISRFGLREDIPRKYCSVFESSAGVKSDELACYAELHRPSPTPCDPPRAVP